MNTTKWSSRLTQIVSRMAAVVVLVSAALPAALLSEASANSNPFSLPALAAEVASNPSQVTQIAAGGTHTCALTPEGGVVCWGANDSGELGDGTRIQKAAPVAVLGLSSGVMRLSLAWGRTCALTTLGRVYCWGGGNDVPVEVVGLGNQVVQLAVGEFHTCALTSSGKVLCWGFNTQGQLGNGTYTDSATPVVAIASGASQITVQNYSSCAVMTSSEVKCWGDGGRGQLGDGGVGSHTSNVPVRVIIQGGNPLTGASQVELGLTFGCAVVGIGVFCWGTNRFGQLGNGVIDPGARLYAAPVLNAAGGLALSGVDQISTGESFACAHLSSGGLKCWGNNSMGQHGNNSGGSNDSTNPAPVTVLNPTGTAPLEGTARVATGSWQTCIFTNWEAAHPFYCWGDDWMGQLGIGSGTGIQKLPQPVADISGLGGGGGSGLEAQIVAGGAHTCSLTTGGGLKCWGSNSNGQLGDGTTIDRQNPVDVAGLSSDVKSMALGDNFSCAVISWGRLKCWGDNTHGQLGAGSTTNSALPLTAILPGVTTVQVAAGSGHTCARTLTGSVLCWGDNASGQLGDGTVTERPAPIVAIVSGAVWIALGGATSCAVMSGGGVKCWGQGDMGQLGDGSSGAGYHQSLPVDVKVSGSSSLISATQVALAANYGCALLTGGTVDCWGKNDVGQLGQGATSEIGPYAVPVMTELGGSPLQGATQITTGGAHACVRLYTDRIKCWGQGEVGQLGDGSSGTGAYTSLPHTVLDHYAPYGQTIPYLEAVSQVSAGSAHTCAFLKWNGDTPYRCWGGNSNGQLGDGVVIGAVPLGMFSTINRIYPNLVQDPLNFGRPPLAKLAAGLRFSCALTGAGGVMCWGDNHWGELGNGTYIDSSTPVGVVGLSSGVVGLAVGDLFACILTSTGGVKCWGANLGDPANGTSTTPVDVTGLSNVIGLSAGSAHVCALTDAGGVKCWGWNGNGQLGNSTVTNSQVPVDVTGLAGGVIDLALGSAHSCGLTSVGGVKCWGWNYRGELGNNSIPGGGASDYSNVPVAVSGLASGVVHLVAGGERTCALTSAGGVKCWGSNSAGLLDGSASPFRNTPVDILGLSSGVMGLVAGGAHICALMTGGGVKCWGYNSDGEVGDGTNTNRLFPVATSGLSGNVISLAAGFNHTCAILGGTSPLRCWGSNTYGQLGTGTTTGSLTPVDSKWLTAAGLVEDEKTVVILPAPHLAVVVPAQPITTPVVVTVTILTSPPPPCTNCVQLDALTIAYLDLDEKPRLPMMFHWNFNPTSGLNAGNNLQAASGFDERYLNLYHYVDGTWIPMLPCTGCSLDTTNHVLIATMDGEGIYAAMVRPPTNVYLPFVTH
jgi:alpha-tubulin suppressor-like RCC1 family protein